MWGEAFALSSEGLHLPAEQIHLRGLLITLDQQPLADDAAIRTVRCCSTRMPGRARARGGDEGNPGLARG